MRPAQNVQPIPAYFVNKKEQFLQAANNMGVDLFAAQDFLEGKGICEAEMNNLLDNMNNPNYINVLKPQMMPPGQQQMQP